MFSFSSIDITFLLPQLHAFQWAVGRWSNFGSFRDTLLYSTCCGAGARPTEQGLPSAAFSSAALHQLLELSSVPRMHLESSCTSMGNRPSRCQDSLAAADPSSSSPAASPHLLWEEGRCAGMPEDQGRDSPALSLWCAGRWEEREGFLDPRCDPYNPDFKYFSYLD